MKSGFLITIEELEQTPSKLETKLRNLSNIAIWKEHYSGKRVVNGIRVKPWRDKIIKMEREIKVAQQQAKVKTAQIKRQKEKERKEAEQYSKFHERVVQFHYAIIDKCVQFKTRQSSDHDFDSETFFAIASRSIGNDIHDFTEVKTGLMTLACYKAKTANSKIKPTPEHFWPRSVVGGRDILEQAMIMGDKFNIRHSIRTLYELCQTVESLNTENRTLMKYQKQDTFVSPQSSYDSAGIKLVRFKAFSLHPNWDTIFQQYNITTIAPYEFADVLTIEDADKTIV